MLKDNVLTDIPTPTFCSDGLRGGCVLLRPILLCPISNYTTSTLARFYLGRFYSGHFYSGQVYIRPGATQAKFLFLAILLLCCCCCVLLPKP